MPSLIDIERKYAAPDLKRMSVEEIDNDLDILHNLISRIYEYRRELINYLDKNKE